MMAKLGPSPYIEYNLFMASTYLLLSLVTFISFGCSCVPEQNPSSHPLKAHKSYIDDKTRDFKGFYWLEHGLERSIMNSIRKEEREEPPLRTEWVVDVDNHGAIGDGVTDDTEAFAKAWNEACTSSFPQPVLLVPQKRKYLLRPIAFNGSCVSDITVMIKGTLVASSNRSQWDGGNIRHWILFNGVRNLAVRGGGTISGNGQIWWQNSCKINKTLPCTGAPTAMTFFSCQDLKVENLRFKDSQKVHVSFEGCTNVAVSKLLISAPGHSPNTDGIHVGDTENMIITECVIRTGDDCVSIVSGSRNVKGMNIVCGPGHGISIGSLGANKTEARVRNVMIDRAMLRDTTNGVRIKSWQGGRGYARGIIFQNIAMHNVENPIIIDQNYCDSPDPCPQQAEAVGVSRVLYRNIKGVSASQVAVNLNCSEAVPCESIMLHNVELVGEHGRRTQSVCTHVTWTASGEIVPAC